MGLRAAAVVVLLTGCISFSSIQKAETLGAGRVQAAVEPGLWGGASGAGAVAVPHVDASVRVGLTERVDLGVRAGSSLLALAVKVLLTEPESRLLAVSMVPTLEGTFLDASSQGGTSPGLGPGGVLGLDLPLLIGVKLREGSEVVVGPRVVTLVLFSDGPVQAALGVGTSLGFCWQVTPGFAVMPELAVLAPLVGRTSAERIFQGIPASGVYVSLKLGVLFGEGRPPAATPP